MMTANSLFIARSLAGAKLTAINTLLRFDPQFLRRHTAVPLIARSLAYDSNAIERTGTCHTRFKRLDVPLR